MAWSVLCSNGMVGIDPLHFMADKLLDRPVSKGGYDLDKGGEGTLYSCHACDVNAIVNIKADTLTQRSMSSHAQRFLM